jgi:uncharacterized OB-fold protein
VCGEGELTERPLGDDETVLTYTVVHVPTPQFEGEAPYVTAIAEFGAVRLTGILDGDPEGAAVGMAVAPDVDDSGEQRRLVFEPRS